MILFSDQEGYICEVTNTQFPGVEVALGETAK